MAEEAAAPADPQLGIQELQPANTEAGRDAAMKAAQDAGIPTLGMPMMPQKDTLGSEMWKSWQKEPSEYPPVPPPDSPVMQADEGFPYVFLFVSAAVALAVVLPMFKGEVDVESVRKKGKPQWRLDVEARLEEEERRIKVEAGLDPDAKMPRLDG